jgi:tetratricopeptide (TPR) repeat protein
MGNECRPIEKQSELAAEDQNFVDERQGFGWGDRCYKHFKAGTLKFARAACQKGLEAGPEPKVRGAILYNLALVDEQSGDKKAACEWLRQSLAVRPAVGVVQDRFNALDCRAVLAAQN